MKRTIAYKKQSAGIPYIILTLLGAVLLISAIAEKEIRMILLCAVLVLVSAVLSVQFLLLPSEIIILSGDGTLILPRGITVPLDSVCAVSCKRARAKGLRYRWGSVILSTHLETYKFGFVADCEDVTICLNQLIREAKQATAAE